MVYENLQDIQKARLAANLADSFEKAGAGSRGGKIIGYTSTNKPIYESKKHESYNSFNEEEASQKDKAHSTHAKIKEDIKDLHSKNRHKIEHHFDGGKHQIVELSTGNNGRGGRSVHSRVDAETGEHLMEPRGHSAEHHEKIKNTLKKK